MRSNLVVAASLVVVCLVALAAFYVTLSRSLAAEGGLLPALLLEYSQTRDNSKLVFQMSPPIAMNNITVIPVLKINTGSTNPTTLYYVDVKTREILRVVMKGDTPYLARTGEYTYLWLPRNLSKGDVIPIGRGYGEVVEVNGDSLILKVYDPCARQYLRAKYNGSISSNYFVLYELSYADTGSRICKLLDYVSSNANLLAYRLASLSPYAMACMVIAGGLLTLLLLSVAYEYMELRKIREVALTMVKGKLNYYEAWSTEIPSLVESVSKLKDLEDRLKG